MEYEWWEKYFINVNTNIYQIICILLEFHVLKLMYLPTVKMEFIQDFCYLLQLNRFSEGKSCQDLYVHMFMFLHACANVCMFYRIYVLLQHRLVLGMKDIISFFNNGFHDDRHIILIRNKNIIKCNDKCYSFTIQIECTVFWSLYKIPTYSTDVLIKKPLNDISLFFNI